MAGQWGRKIVLLVSTAYVVLWGRLGDCLLTAVIGDLSMRPTSAMSRHLVCACVCVKVKHMSLALTARLEKLSAVNRTQLGQKNM